MKLFIKTMFTLFLLFVGVTLLYASSNGFLNGLGNVLIFVLFGVSIQIIVEWLITEE